ncbi:MAG TPA: zinc-dependent metalloprotease [Acidimicrobiales bacterium]|nr:zinc-dependent metalloprotease [Acidimicrobiales bacterium]
MPAAGVQAGPIDWGLAERVAIRVAGREPLAASYHYDRLAADFTEATARAEELVAATTGLRSHHGHARARVVDRPDWVRANLASFGRMLRPLTDKLASRASDRRGAAAAWGHTVSRRAAGVEVGALLGWMATRVLGQYDLLIIEDENPDDQDLVYYVGPNVLALEKRYAFPPQEFRLWLALHEVTHRAQFTGVPWLRGHFLSLVERTLDEVDPDPKRFLEALGRVVDDLRAGRNPLDDGGLATILANPDQRELIGRIGGLMSLLEGHGDVTMDRAGEGHVPSAPRFARALRERRRQAGGAAKVLQKLLGIDAKFQQYAQGEKFIAHVERHGGPGALDAAWRGPEWLPTLAEIRSPQEWLDRIRLSEELVG